MEQQAALAAGSAVERGDDRVDRVLLLGKQVGALGGRGQRGAGGRPAQARAAGGDEAALLQALQGLAVGADRRGQLAARHLPLPQSLQHRPLLDAEPAAAAQRLLPGRQDLRPQLELGADRAAAGPGPRRQHQLQAARGRRAVLAGDPEAEPDQLRRGTGLERLDRLRQPLRRPAPRSRPARRRRPAACAARTVRGRRCRPRDPPSPPAGGSRTGPAGSGRWSAARP